MGKKLACILLFVIAVLWFVFKFSDKSITHTQAVLHEFGCYAPFKIIAYKNHNTGSLVDGKSFSVVMVLQPDEINQLLVNNRSRKETLINNVEDIVESFRNTFPTIYLKNSNMHPALFYHSISAMGKSKRSGNVGFFIDEKSNMVFLEYWES